MSKDHTERARQVLDRWCGSHLHHFIPVDPSKGEDPAAYLELHDLITDALSAVASEPTIVAKDHTERARRVIALVENCAGDAALLVGAIAAEFSAATVEALERMWGAAEKQEQLEAEIASLREQVNFFKAQYQDEIGLDGMREQQTALLVEIAELKTKQTDLVRRLVALLGKLARLQEPDDALVKAVAVAMCEAWFYCGIDKPDGLAQWRKTESENMKKARAAIAKIEEMLK